MCPYFLNIEERRGNIRFIHLIREYPFRMNFAAGHAANAKIMNS
jgi:hypothetical protein